MDRLLKKGEFLVGADRVHHSGRFVDQRFSGRFRGRVEWGRPCPTDTVNGQMSSYLEQISFRAGEGALTESTQDAQVGLVDDVVHVMEERKCPAQISAQERLVGVYFTFKPIVIFRCDLTSSTGGDCHYTRRRLRNVTGKLVLNFRAGRGLMQLKVQCIMIILQSRSIDLELCRQKCGSIRQGICPQLGLTGICVVARVHNDGVGLQAFALVFEILCPALIGLFIPI